MIEAFLITWLGVVAAQASPGPNLLAVASVGLSQGRQAALMVTLGVSSGMLIWAVAVSFGLGTLFTAYPVSLILLKIIGGSYLLWLALRTLRSVFSNKVSVIEPSTHITSHFQNWKRGVVVVLTNPKAALMWSAVATFLFGAGLHTWQVALFGPVGATSGFLIYGSYALLFSTGTVNRLYRGYTRWIDALFSTAFGALGGKLLIDGLKEVRN